MLGLFLAAAVAGVGAGQFIYSSVTCRNAIGLRAHRGPLLAVVEGAGVYQCDLDRAQDEWADRNPDLEDESELAPNRPTLGQVIANFRSIRRGRDEPVSEKLIDRQFALTSFQFPPKAWLIALRSNGLSARALRRNIAENIGAQSWIEKQIEPSMSAREEECAAYYQAHSASFALPVRIRASHIFFAAPPLSTPELIEAKRLAAQAIIDRLALGEKFSELVANSEDEASKKQGGDLNFFSEQRMPADFWSGVKGMRSGEPATLIRTSLGFHVVQVTESRSPRQIPLEEARPDIFVALKNEKRALAVSALTVELARTEGNLQIP
jgi:hypothetical protein